MNYVAIPFARLAFAVVFVLLAIYLSHRERLGLGRDLIVGALRAGVQLIVIGYVLLVLFAHERPAWVVLALGLMSGVAAWTSAGRIEHGPGARRLLPYALAAVLAGAAAALVPAFAVIVRPHPWFSARYVVPLSGMMLANAMNVVAQVFERIFAQARAEAATIEQLLGLGASPRQALERYHRAAIRAALMPTINGLLTVGLVSLPGMMTGQIVGGVAPEQAVRYQIVVMFQLVTVAAVSASMSARFAERLLFTKRAQLVTFGA